MLRDFGSLAPFGLVPSWPDNDLCSWYGASGFAYFHSVYPFTRTIWTREANYVFVRRELNGMRTPLYVGQTDDLSKRLPDHHKFDAALRLGANELHVHHLARSSAERFRIETDLRNGLHTPLNDQPSMGGLFGLARLYDPFK